MPLPTDQTSPEIIQVGQIVLITGLPSTETTTVNPTFDATPIRITAKAGMGLGIRQPFKSHDTLRSILNLCKPIGQLERAVSFKR